MPLKLVSFPAIKIVTNVDDYEDVQEGCIRWRACSTAAGAVITGKDTSGEGNERFVARDQVAQSQGAGNRRSALVGEVVRQVRGFRRAIGSIFNDAPAHFSVVFILYRHPGNRRLGMDSS